MVAAKRPTIRDVAEAAGVSKSLAALVFSTEGGVSTDRREKVQKKKKKLGYTPNQWARSLRSGSGSFVGILLNDLHNPLLIQIADLTRKILLEKGQQSLISAAVITEKNGKRIVDPSSIHSLLDLRPKALVIVGGLPDLKPFKQIPDTIPVIVASSQASSLPNATIVRADDQEALRLLVGHLIELGHSKIAYVGPTDSENSIARRDAYLSSMEFFGLGDLAVTQLADRFEDRGYAAAKLLLQGANPPTAIVAFNDNIAFGVQSAVQELVAAGRSPVAVTGFDNTFVAELGMVSLTSIEQEKEAIAMKIAEILTTPDGVEDYRGQEIKLMPRLIARKSTFRI